MAFLCSRCRVLDTARKKKCMMGALLVFFSLYLLVQRHSNPDNIVMSNRDLLLALGKQGSARDVHGHRFKYLGIDGKWLPVSDTTPGAISDSNTGQVDTGQGYHLETPSKRDFSRGQSLVIDKLLDHKVNGFFMEIGAGDGETNSISLFFERWRQWKGLLIEPEEEKFEFIMSKNRTAAAWNTCVRTSNMSMFRGKVPCDSISHVLDKVGREVIDILSVNLRGQAMDIIQDIDLKKYRVTVLTVEFNQDEERSLEYNAMTKYLLQRGYEVKHIQIEKHLHIMDVIYMWHET